MEQKVLSKSQGYIIQSLAAQLSQLQAQISDAKEAVKEQAELLRVQLGLPEGTATFAQSPDGWVLQVEEEAK